MSKLAAVQKRSLTVALVGNPNTGKSTLFSALVGVYQRVGNYPGVTVEKRTGRFEHAGWSFEVIDLPGLYSLAPRSRDELVAVDVLLGRERGMDQPDLVLCVVDASNLERNLYLVGQLLELDIPLVIALNMMDLVQRHDVQIDIDELSRRLGVPVVPVQAHRGIGLGNLRQTLARIASALAAGDASHTKSANTGLAAAAATNRGAAYPRASDALAADTLTANEASSEPRPPNHLDHLEVNSADTHPDSDTVNPLANGSHDYAVNYSVNASVSDLANASPAPASSVIAEVFARECDRLWVVLEREGLAQPLAPRSPVSGFTSGEQATGRDGPLPPAARFWMQRLILDVTGFLTKALFGEDAVRVIPLLEASRARLRQAGFEVPASETELRYRWVQQVLEGVVKFPPEPKPTISDRLDSVLTHRVWGTAIFVLVMLLMFQAVFRLAEPLNDLIDFGVQAGADWVTRQMPAGAFRSLLVDGVLSGVGAVLTFIPQIAILFLFIGVLEDCGYVARAAFLMDRFMSRLGLSGKSFIPMLSSFACTVPGIMATRTIENERDRLTTILVAPLMTCSARLPVYALLIAVFIPDRRFLGGTIGLQGLVLASLYALGILMAMVVALTLKRTLLRGRSPSFVLELPGYKWPSLRAVLLRVWERVMVFLRNAGTIIAAISVLVWATLYYPHDPRTIDRQLLREKRSLEVLCESLPPQAPQRQNWEKRLQEIEQQITGEYQRHSILGRFGRMIEPVFRPLGWDWRIGTAVIASFPAREVVVATLGVMFNLGDVDAEEQQSPGNHLQQRLKAAVWEGTQRPVFNIPVALSLMVFYALCAQCAATLVVIRRETNSWRWPIFTFGYMTTLAYCGALVTYQLISTIMTGI